MDADPEVDHLPARNEVVHAYSDHSLAAETFGDLRAGVDLRTGLRRMAEWVGPGTRATGSHDVR